MSIDDVQFDVLDSGSEPDRRRRAAVAVLAVVLVLVVLAGWFVDRRSRQAEFEALTRCRATALAAVKKASSEASFMAEYIRPATAFVTGVSADRLYSLVSGRVIPVLQPVQRARAGCDALTTHGWHHEQAAARVALVAWIDAESDRYEATAADGRVYFSGQEQVSDLRDRAATALAAARPGFPW